MPRPQPGYSAMQALFLLRAARLGELYRKHRYRPVPTDGRTVLVCWALRSTLADCLQLGVEAEARALLAASLGSPTNTRLTPSGDDR
jgi:hypothetical protein